MALQRQGKGIIFLCGYSHAQGVVTELRKEREIIYCWPHGRNRQHDVISQSAEVKALSEGPVLQGHIHELPQSGSEKLIERVRAELMRYF